MIKISRKTVRFNAIKKNNLSDDNYLLIKPIFEDIINHLVNSIKNAARNVTVLPGNYDWLETPPESRSMFQHR